MGAERLQVDEAKSKIEISGLPKPTVLSYLPPATRRRPSARKL
jgi:hypothetical protein